MNRPARSLPGVPWQRHPSESDDRVASPGDDDLTMDLVGVVIAQPVVYERDICIHYQAERGWTTDGEVETTSITPFGGSISVVLSEESISEPQFDWIVGLLERWATIGTPLRFVAAPDRLSALYAPDGEFAALPAV